MQKVVACLMLSFGAGLFAQPQTTDKTKPQATKKTTASSAHTVAKASTPNGKKAPAARTVAATAKTGAHTGGTRSRGKRAKAKAGPSYQLHPDPERYQQIQQALADRGYFKGQVNGEWGDDSVAALKKFQDDQKLEPDGKINSLSLIGLGLGPRHDGSTAIAAPVPPAPPPTTEGPPPADDAPNPEGESSPN